MVSKSLNYTIFFCLVFTSMIFSQSFNSDWQIVSLGEYIGDRLMKCIDVNNDNKDEIYVVGRNGCVKMEYINNGYYVTHATDLYDFFSGVSCAAIYHDSIKTNIYLITEEGEVQIYNANELELIDRFRLFNENEIPSDYNISSFMPSSCAIADLNLDCRLEIIICGYQYLTILDETTKEKIYFSNEIKGNPYSNIVVGNIDSDSTLEVIIPDGTIYDFNKMGIENEFKSGYPNAYKRGFNKNLILVDIDNDKKNEILFSDGDYADLFIINGDLTDTLYRINAKEGVSLTKWENVDNDQENELVVGIYQGSFIKIFDLNPLSLSKEIKSINSLCVSNSSVGDVDGDGQKEIVWSLGGCSTGEDLLVISDLSSGKQEWVSTDLKGPYNVSLFNTQEENQKKIYASSSYSYSNWNGYIEAFYNPFVEIEYLQKQFQTIAAGDFIKDFECVYNSVNKDSLLLIAGSNYVTIYNLRSKTRQIIKLNEGDYFLANCTVTGDFNFDDSLDALIGTSNGSLIGYNLYSQNKEFIYTSSSTQAMSIYDVLLGGISIGDKNKIYYTGKNYLNDGFHATIGCLDLISNKIEWVKILSESLVYNLSLADLDSDGLSELYAGQQNGDIIKIVLSNNELSTFYKAGFPVTNILFKNIDLDPGLETIINGEKLLVLNTNDFKQKFISNKFNSTSFTNDLVVIDYDQDSFMNIIISNPFGIFSYESLEPYENPSGVVETKGLVLDFNLFQNYPNPFNPSTIINYSIPYQSKVSLVVYDALGRVVNTLVNEEKSAGNHTAELNAANLSSGIYFYQIRAGEFIQTKKMVLLR